MKAPRRAWDELDAAPVEANLCAQLGLAECLRAERGLTWSAAHARGQTAGKIEVQPDEGGPGTGQGRERIGFEAQPKGRGRRNHVVRRAPRGEIGSMVGDGIGVAKRVPEQAR